MMRLDKFLSERLGIPRSESRKLLLKGQVQLSGVTCKQADTKIDEAAAEVTVAGQDLAAGYEKYVYIMLHKPVGVVCATKDKRDPTVTDLVAADYPRRQLFPAGRLDKTSTGFVLLTDDGALAHNLVSPAHHVSKQYLVTLDAPLTDQVSKAFEQGVTLADGETMAPAKVSIAGDDPRVVKVILQQGVYHQIKRMFGVYGIGVDALHRTEIGGVALDKTLAPGAYRALTAAELALLQSR